MLSINSNWPAGHRITVLAATGVVLALTAWPALTQQPGQETEVEVLQPITGPPPQIAALEQELAKKLPPPPAPATAAELIEKISKRPGQAKKIKAAKAGVKQGTVQSRGSITSPTISTSTLVLAPNPWSVTLTTQADSYGAHAGLRNSYTAFAYLYGAFVNSSYPNNRYAYLRAGLNWETNTVNPMVYLYVNVPSSGYYTINLNGYIYNSNVQLKLPASTGTASKLLDDFPGQSGWADYASLQYLAAGSHVFYFVLPGGGYVSRISVACYMC